tara:strand:- start:1669 stop:1965 length:297 start_codon:yes stop_codon:yes gene_type:complete
MIRDYNNVFNDNSYGQFIILDDITKGEEKNIGFNQNTNTTRFNLDEINDSSFDDLEYMFDNFQKENKTVINILEQIYYQACCIWKLIEITFITRNKKY